MISRWGEGSSWDARAKESFGSPAALDAGDLGVWSSSRALPLRPSRCSRAAGLGGARRSSGGGVSFAGGEPYWTATTQRWSLAHLVPPRSLRLADNHVLTPFLHHSLGSTRPVCSLSGSTSRNGLED